MSVLSSVKRILSTVIFIPVIAFGQATLKGTVTDAANKETLIGVNVVVIGTSLGAATDIEGQFRIVGIPARVLNVKISCIGYEPQVKEIDFSKTSDVVINIQLKSAIIQGEEVVVTAQMRGQIAAINQQITSNTIINVVSEDKIKELPDANAAEAIGRLPGVSIVRSGGEASQVVLRGLSSSFSNITVDGVKIPATDATTRDVDLSTIAQGSLSGIELYKTLTPDMDADAIAGTVNLVTRKAPSQREVKVDAGGGYNNLMKSAKQYDFQARYGERFFDDFLGLQIQGNMEKKIRSREFTGCTWALQKSIAFQSDSATGKYSQYSDYSNLGSSRATFTDESRARQGIQAIIDFNTSDSGSVKLSGMYSGTGRDITTHSRVYVGTAATAYWDYNYEYNELRINTVNASLQGKNFLGGLEFTWSASYAKSVVDNPYDFALKFTGGGANGTPTNTLDGDIKRANNDYSAAVCSTGVYKKQNNFDQEKTGFLNIIKKYAIGTLFSGEVKGGAKYKEKNRWMTVDEYDDNNYLYADFYHDGIDTVAIRNSRFASYYGSGTGISLERFLDPSPPSRNLLGKYPFNPLINVDALRLWYDLYKNANNGGNREFLYSLAGKLTNYNVTERVSSAYLMNTLNIGQFATVLAGVRVEKEDNDYIAEYCTGSLGTVGIAITASRPVLDSIAHFTQTHLLPNIQLTLKPTSFLNVRLAAYKAIARPGYNMRLAQFFDSSASGQMAITSGNTRLKNMEAWNYEANAQFFGDNFGLISISGFYKRITNFFHRTNSLNLDNGDFSRLCKQFDIVYTDSAIIQTIYGGNGIRASVAYNDPDPSYFWGLEFEHQMNFGFLPGYFKNITLSYNISLTRSLVHVIYGTTEVTLRKDSTRSGLPGHFIYTYSYTPVYHRTYRVQENNTEGQPELYGNAALGYDIGGFSVRLSCFYQDAYVRSYSALDQANIHVDPFFKVDLSLKQQITNSISIFLNINNLNNQSETTTTRNAYTGLGIQSWLNPNTEELYGRTIDLGVRLSL